MSRHYVDTRTKEVSTSLGTHTISTSPHRRPYGVAKYQHMVLEALKAKGVENANEADSLFDEIGIKVTHKRVGRRTQPVVGVIRQVGGWTKEGDADYHPLPTRDFSALAEWIEEE